MPFYSKFYQFMFGYVIENWMTLKENSVRLLRLCGEKNS